MAVVELRELVKEYGVGARGVVALRGISLVIEPARFVTITGPNGAGKSTLLNLVGALDSPTRGAVVIDGDDLATLSESRLAAYHRSVGFVLQTLNLLSELTAWENVAFPLMVEGCAPLGVRAQAVALLEALGIGHRADHHPAELSISERQRVAVGRALIGHPALVIADEPTGHLDAQSGARVLELLRGRVTGEGATVITASHHPAAAVAGDRRLELADGRLVGDVELSGRAVARSRARPGVTPRPAPAS